MLLAGLLLFAGNLNAETVRLQWDSNTEPDLATGSKPRYKIYVRDGQSLQGNKANATSVWSVLVADDEDPRAEYVLRTISLDRLSFVAVTAIDEAGNESGLSNEVFWPKTGPALATKGSLSWVEKEPHVAITFSRAQTTKSADGANPTATFDSTPSEGNLIVAACFSRSGNSTTTHSISGSGWTKRIARDAQLADSSYRRSISVWTKAAGASEATAIQISGDTVRLVIQEFTAGESGATWTFEDSVDNDNGATANATTIATGTTDSIGAGDLLLIGIGGSKCGPDTSQQSFSWDNLGEAQSFDTTDSYTRMVGVAFDQESASGTRTSTATLGGGATANSGLSAAIIVFSAEVAPAGGVTIEAGAIDGILLGDSSLKTAIFNVVSSDGVALGDTDSRTGVLLSSSSDTIILSDSVLNIASLLSQVSDTIILSDSVLGDVLTTIQALVNEGIVFSDGSSALSFLNGSVSDGITLGDIVSSVLALYASSSDGVSLGDNNTNVVFKNVLAADGIILNDSNSVIAFLNAISSENILLADSNTVIASLNALAADGITLSELASWAGIISALSNDGIILSDSSLKTLRSFVSSADSIVFSDGSSVVARYTVTVSDTIQFADAISTIARLNVILNDGVSLSDISIGVNTTNLPNGEIQISFSAKNINFVFTVKKIGINFSNKNIGVSFSKN